MSKLMWIAGILLIAAGVALGLMVFTSPAPVGEYGIRLEQAVMLFVGGILSLGLGSVIDALRRPAAVPALRMEQPVAAPVPPQAPIPEFGRKTAETAAVTGAAGAAGAALETPDANADEISESTRDTLRALEQARQKIEQSLIADSKAERASMAEEPEEALSESQLYVVEERFIRMRPARILSDGTVEAETDEGWMRFENLEHLDEYFDAMETARG